MKIPKEDIEAAREAMLKVLQVPPDYLMPKGPLGSKAVIEPSNQENLNKTTDVLSKSDIESYFNN